MSEQPVVVLAGNPNSGKTTIFNLLTGARQRTANYPGITVTHTIGTHTSPDGQKHQIIDLPGTYSLSALSPEEQVAQRFLLGDGSEEQRPDCLVIVVDATNLERNLYLTSQLVELGLPTVVLLNMMDVAERRGLEIDLEQLASCFQVPVVPTVAHDASCLEPILDAVRTVLEADGDEASPARRFSFSDDLEEHLASLGEAIRKQLPHLSDQESDFLARRVVGDTKTPLLSQLRAMPALLPAIAATKADLGKDDLDETEIQLRYAWLREEIPKLLSRPADKPTKTDVIDRVVLNKFVGPLILLSVFAALFSSVFTVASYPMDWIDAGKAGLIDFVGGALSPGPLNSLLTDGIIEGVGAVVIFIPQILMLFLIVALLEDFGYMSRAAFILDRLLSRVGLSGRAFVPLLSSFACAIPGVMATRSIPSRRERFATILIAPLMVCSARLPVYSILIAAFIVPAYGALAGGVTFVGLYFLGIVAAAAVAFVLGRTLLKGEREPLLLELPDYRRPSWRNIGQVTLERTWDFIRNAGTIILSISIILWFLATHPAPEVDDEVGLASADTEQTAVPQAETAPDANTELENSYAGKFGHFIEPVIKPLGYDWKIGIGLLTSFAAREVFVGTMSTLYGLSEDDDEAARALTDRLRDDTDSEGSPRYNLLTALSLLLFYAFACQCMSTLAVVAREMRSWRWAAFMMLYMTALAYGSALIVYQGGRLLGFG